MLNSWERKRYLIPSDGSGVINDDNGRGFDIDLGGLILVLLTTERVSPTFIFYKRRSVHNME